MKKILVVVLVAALALIGANAAMAGVTATKHDLSVGGTSGFKDVDATAVEVCVYCHTPHGTNATAKKLLWNRALSTNANYGVYANDTMTGGAVEIGLAPVDGSVKTTHLCMSCHDGTIAVNNPINKPNTGVYGATPNLLTGTANLGTDLTNDHPINFNYTAALATTDGGLFSPISVNAVIASLPLFGGTGSMQCATCHNVHDNVTAPPFLRINNAVSALCKTCHTNK